MMSYPDKKAEKHISKVYSIVIPPLSPLSVSQAVRKCGMRLVQTQERKDALGLKLDELLKDLDELLKDVE